MQCPLRGREGSGLCCLSTPENNILNTGKGYPYFTDKTEQEKLSPVKCCMQFVLKQAHYRKRHIIQHILDISRQISHPVKNTPYKVSKCKVKEKR